MDAEAVQLGKLFFGWRGQAEVVIQDGAEYFRRRLKHNFLVMCVRFGSPKESC